MNNIMKLADAYAECMYLRREKHEVRAALEAAVTAFEKDAKRTLHLLKQALSVIDGSYSEDYDEAFEGAVSDALRKEITDMETK